MFLWPWTVSNLQLDVLVILSQQHLFVYHLAYSSIGRLAVGKRAFASENTLRIQRACVEQDRHVDVTYSHDWYIRKWGKVTLLDH